MQAEINQKGGSGGAGQRELIPLLNIRSTLGPLSAPPSGNHWHFAFL